MIKLSFRFQLAMILITVAIVVAFVIVFVNNAGKEAAFAQIKAAQCADIGMDRFFKTISEKSMCLETGAIFIDSIQDFSGVTDDGGEYSVRIVKDTISTDSIEIRIESRGVFGKEIRSQRRNILLISPDSVNWMPENMLNEEEIMLNEEIVN